MANKLTIEVVVSDNGTAKIVQKGIEGVGKAAEGTTKKTREASKAQDELNYKLNQGATGVSSAARSFSKLNQAIGEGPNGLVGAYATLAANAFAVSAAFNALREAAQVEQMMKGLEVQSARTGVALKNISSNIVELTGYSISMADAMKTTALMSSAGFSTKNMEELTVVANNAALALGRNIPDALDRISKGVTKLEPELLDELGIMTKLTEAYAQYGLQQNKSVAALSSFEKRQALANAVIAEGTLKFGGLNKEVEANPYDRLAASFDNLIKNILNFANIALKPLASLLSNGGVLTGVLILFVSTIRQQLLPALYLMGKVAADRRQHFLDLAEGARDAAKATLELANAQKKASVKAKTEAFIDPKNRTRATPKGFDYEAAAINAVDQNVAANAKDIAKLDNSISSRMKNIKRERGELTEEEMKSAGAVKGWSKDYIAQKEAEVESIRKVKAELIDLYKTQKEGEASVIAAKAKSKAENTKFRANEKAAAAERLRGEAIELAGEGKWSEARAKRSESLDEYRKKLAYDRIANQREGKMQLPKMFDSARVGMASINSGAQIAAAGFMRLIPYIGAVVTAVGLAYAGYEKFFLSDLEKARIAAIKKFTEAVKVAKDSVKDLARIQQSNASVGEKAASILITQSNIATGLAEAYNDVKEAAASSSTEVQSYWESLGKGAEGYAQYSLGLSSTDIYGDPNAMVGAAVESYSGGWRTVGAVVGSLVGVLGLGLSKDLTMWGAKAGENLAMSIMDTLPTNMNGIDEVARDSIIAVDALTRSLGRDYVDGLVLASTGTVDLQKNQENLRAGMTALANNPALREQFLHNAAKAYAGVADSVKALQDAFRSTGDAISKFVDGATNKTPIDDIVKGFQSINRAFSELDSTIGGSDITKQAELLAGMPVEVQRMLSTQSAASLDGLRQQSVVITDISKEIKELRDLGAERDQQENARLSALREQLPLEQARLQTITLDVAAIREEFREKERILRQNQVILRNTQNQLTLVNAISSVYSDVYSKTEAGERARINRHNQAIALQKAQLQVQISMLNAQIAHDRARIAELNSIQQAIRGDQRLTELAANRLKIEKETTRQRQAQALSVDMSSWVASVDKAIAEWDRLDRQANYTTRNLQNVTYTNGNLGNLTEEQRLAVLGYVEIARTATLAAREAAAVTETVNLEVAIQSQLDAISNLQTQMAALTLQEIKSGQANALIINRREDLNRILLESEEALTLAKLAQTEAQAELNKALAGGTSDNIIRSLQSQTAQYREQFITSRQAYRQKAIADAAELRTTRGRIADIRNLSQAEQTRLSQELQGLVELEKNLTTKINRELEVQRITENTNLLLAKRAMLEILLGNGLEDSIGTLRESITLRERELEIVQQLVSKQTSLAQARSTLNITRAGGQVNERTTKQFAVENAQIALNAAKEAYSLRIQSIDAEYDLLDAQKTIQEQEIRSRIFLISAMSRLMGLEKDEGLQRNIAELTDAASNISRVNYTSMRANAKAAAGLDLQSAAVALEQAVAERDQAYRPTLDPVVNGFENLRAQLESQQRMQQQTALSAQRQSTAENRPRVTIETAQLEELYLQTSYLEDILNTLSSDIPGVSEKEIANSLNNSVAQVTTSAAGSVADATMKPVDALRLAIKRAFGEGSYIGDNARHTKYVMDPDTGRSTGRISDHYGPDATALDFIPQAGLRAFDAATVQRMLETELAKLGYELRPGSGNRIQFFGPGAPIKPGDDSHEDHFHSAVRRIAGSVQRLDTGVQQAAGTVETLDRTQETRLTTEQRREKIRQMDLQTQFDPETAAGRAASAVIGAVNTGVKTFSEMIIDTLDDNLTKMSQLGEQVSQRMGQDFGPQGMVVSAISNLMKQTLLTSKTLVDAFNKLQPTVQPPPPTSNIATGLAIGQSASQTMLQSAPAIGRAIAANMETSATTPVSNVAGISSEAPATVGAANATTPAAVTNAAPIPPPIDSSLEGSPSYVAQQGLGAETQAGIAATDAAVNNSVNNASAASEKVKASFSSIAGAASQAFGSVASQIGAVAGLLKASSDAKIAQIDREIAAEQKRDGRSAGSLAKIEAMEKKKDAMARKQFNTQKKLMIAQAVMSTAAGVAGALSLVGTIGPAAYVLAAITGAMGLAQVAIISGMQFEGSGGTKSASMPSSLSIGKRGDSVNLAGGPNANAGGEVGYLRGAAGTGTSAANYRTIGSAYGGEMMRGYGNRGFVVGEKGPEVINPETPISVTPANDVNSAQPINANISIQALDGADVKRVLVDNRGNIIQMLREAANNSGQRFLEDVNVNVYTRPNIGKL